MSMRRTIGIALACFVTTTCAAGEIPEESTSHYPGETTGFRQGNGETPTGESRISTEGILTTDGSPIRAAEQVEQRSAIFFEPTTEACGGIPDPCCSALRPTGITLFGKAAWYNLLGRRTANGELLDTVTATAAHRTLPLASYAKVTNLRNYRSIVVKINDRGPYTRGRILDLSPRAADALDMKRVGVAAVIVEPLVNQATPTVAVLETSGPVVLQ